MAAPVPYIGSRITLITNKNIRYEGILVHIDPQESTVALSQVRAFGTEERIPVDGLPIAATNEIYDYIIFRSSDIKDLTVSELPGAANPSAGQRGPSDPAIVQQPQPQAGLYSPFAGGAQPQQQQQYGQWQQPYMMNPWALAANNPALYYQMMQQQQQQYAMQMQQMQQQQANANKAGAPAAATPVAAVPAAASAPAAAAPVKQEAPKQAAPAPAVATPTTTAAPSTTAAPAPAKQSAPAPAKQPANVPVGGQRVQPQQQSAPSRDPKNPWGRSAGSAPSAAAPAQQQSQPQQARPQAQQQTQQRPQGQQSSNAARPTSTTTPVGGVRSYAGAAGSSSRGGAANTFHRQTAHTGRFPTARPGAPQRVSLPSDFDFEAANKKFDKEKLEAEIESEKQLEVEDEAYNKDDFFDRLSCEALEKLQVDVDGEAKNDRGALVEQRKKDSETFGVSAVRSQYYGSHQGGQYYGSQQGRGGASASGPSNRGRGGYASAATRGGRPAGANGGSQNSNWRNAPSGNNTRGGSAYRGGRGGQSNNQQQQQPQHHGNQQKVFRPVQRNQGEAVKS